MSFAEKIILLKNDLKKGIAGIFSLFIYIIGFSQVSDNFSDGDFTNNPVWDGTTTNFIVNASQQLQLNAASAGISYLSTPHNLGDFDNKEWNFWVRQNFPGSANNYGRIYLISQSADLTRNPDGIYLQLGEALSTDAVRLMQRSGGVTKQICASSDGTIASAFEIRIKVIRDNQGTWSLYVDFSGGFDYTLTATGSEEVKPTGTHIGHLCVYTVGNVNRFFLDDVYAGEEIIDKDPPEISSIQVISSTQIDVTFSEEITSTTAENTNNYAISPAISLSSAAINGTNPKLVHLELSTTLINGTTYTFTSRNIEDTHGNISTAQSLNFTYLVSEIPVIGDIIINEFMADPTPVVGLPETEFVEIYNVSNKIFNLSGWKLGDNLSFGTIQTGWLWPGEFIILCPIASVPLFPNAVGVSGFPNLNNSGDDIIITDNNNIQLDKITYDLSWYRDLSKQDGGWTIERINPTAPCSESSNWRASINPDGGTPGAQNSVYDSTPDTLLPVISSVLIKGINELEIIFDEFVDSASLSIATITTTPSLTEANRMIAGQHPISFKIEFTDTIAESQYYSIAVAGIEDCWGNIGNPASTFVRPSQAESRDVIINEFMANPSPVVGLPETEFVEIYNVSNKVFDITGWKLGDNATFGTIQNGWLMPGEYLILCPISSVSRFTNAIGVANFPNLNNSGDDIVLIDNNNLQLDKISYNLSWYKDLSKQDGGWTIECINPLAPCPESSNWRASINPNGGTPGAQNSVYDITADTLSPGISSIVITGSNELEIIFDEFVDSASLSIATITTTPSLTEVNRTTTGQYPLSVKVEFAESFLESQYYTITISGVEDCWGNIGNPASTFVCPSQAESGDIIINEFMANPFPANGLPETEFVEIYNVSNKVFDITGWKLGDNSTFGTIQNGWLMPGEFAVLCPTVSAPLLPNAIGVTNFPNLNNSGDDIIIIDNNNIQLDKITYDLSWYKDPSKQNGGWTIERINPLAPCSESSNWRASINPDGGTPGIQNSVYDSTPDTLSPVISSILITGSNELEIIFDEFVDSVSLSIAAITTNPTLTEVNRTTTGQYPLSFKVEFAEPFLESQYYSITISGAEDCWGNAGSSMSTFVHPSQAEIGDIIINEFMANPFPANGLPETEFVEIYNVSNKIFDITGWKLGDNTSFGTIQNGWLMPGEYLTLCPASSVTQFIKAVGVTGFPTLNNADDDIVITDNNSVQLDKITYDLSWYKDPSKQNGGWTIERINPHAPCSQPSNWRASVDSNGGTPGIQNSVYDITPDIQPAFISSVLITAPNEVEIVFNKPVDSAALNVATVITDPLLTEHSRTITDPYPVSFRLELTEAISEGEHYSIKISDVKDCWGNTGNTTSDFVLPSLADSSDVVINEILFDQYTGGSDWIELYNKSDKLINLKGWKIARLINDNISDHKVIPSNYLLHPGDYVVIGADSNFVINNYPAAISGKFYQLSIPTMPNDEGSVVVIYPVDTADAVMDQVIYSGKWHFKLIDSKDGKSLERIDPNLPTQDQNNWHTAAESVGFATPGGKNSQYYPALYNGEVNLSSETISPDNDGFEDVLQINYQMNTPGMLATVKIFDDRGRIIKTVVQNELLGINGSIIWDGVREDGQKADIGTYVLLMEAFDINGGGEFVSKKAFVVAGRL